MISKCDLVRLLPHLEGVVLGEARHGPGGVRLPARVRGNTAVHAGTGRPRPGCTAATAVGSPMRRSVAGRWRSC
jgi:hypothetical protein